MDLHCLLLLCVLIVITPLLSSFTELLSGVLELILSYLSIPVVKNQVKAARLAKELDKLSDNEELNCIGFSIDDEENTDEEEFEDD